MLAPPFRVADRSILITRQHELHRHFRVDRSDRPGCDDGRHFRYPGRHARTHREKTRPSLGRRGCGRGLGNADLRLRFLAACADLGLCRFSGAQRDAAMIVVLLNGYIALLALFVWLRFIPLNLFWKVSPVLVLLLLLVGLFIPMGWGAPQGPVLVVRNSVQIVPDVAGEVLEVPVAPNQPLKAGEVLFRIDPTPYHATVKALEAQL